MIAASIIGTTGRNGTITAKYLPIDEIAGLLREIVKRPVVNETPLTGHYDAYLEFAPPAHLPFMQGPPTAPALTDAIQELGLQLEPTMAPTDVFVIDQVERPSPN